ncbi:MAG: BON domain-containing protein, partial [Acidobacteria bacterium]|nr:BON domain-containing protein [Acidobacteriota bacterium]
EFAIEVRVVRGIAYLSGRVRTRALAERAAGLARSVAGVSRVQTNLQVSGEPAPAPADPVERRAPSAIEFSELESTPRALAVGVSVGWSVPRAAALKTRFEIGPLIRLGSPRGLGPVLGFDWFQADLQSVEGSATITRVHIKPVMLGVGYTLASNGFSVAPSVVAGYAFNSLTITDTGRARGLPVEVSNSFVWRIGLSAWYDTSRRTAVNASAGYLMTRLGLTVLDADRLARRTASGNTAVVHVGVAYKLF